ncbi:MAG: hypothetical protein LUQ19_03280 [Methanoregula sp.]|nr:hypothetical protein [Methanoregula sp.]
MDDSDEFNEPYYPARYREYIRKKKQRRLVKKIGMIAGGIIAVVVVYILLSGAFSGSPQPVPSPTPTVTPLRTTVTVTAVATTMPIVTPARTTVPASLTMTKPTAGITVTTTGTPEPIQTASAGTYMVPEGDTGPKITEGQAKIIAATVFPDLPAGDVTVQVSTNPEFGLVWTYFLRAGTVTEAGGLIDAVNGKVLTFNRTIHAGGRPQNPVLTLPDARAIAEKTISDKNNVILSINMSSSRYIPLATQSGNIAGIYRFIHTRTIDDYPCDADGFIVSVDAVSGAVTEYVQHWQNPDNAFAMVGDALVPRFDATYAVQTRAKSLYPSSVTSLRILSSELRWKDRHDPATTPRPATIPLAWKVVFDDDVIRANPKLSPGTGWVDSQSGEIIGFEYQH